MTFFLQLVLLAGWRLALLVEVMPILLLMALLQIPRRQWDADAEPRRKLFGRALLQPFALLREAPMRRLSIAGFVYSGMQLSFVAFMTTHLTKIVGFDLIHAGQALATYQVTGAATRPVWGWIADRFLTPSQTLAVHGLGMAAAAIAAGQFGPGWPSWLIFLVAAIAGSTAGGYTGVVYAEYAHLGGARRTEATGLGTAILFAGVLVIPSTFGLAVTALGGYAIAYTTLALLALASALLLCLDTWTPRAADTA